MGFYTTIIAYPLCMGNSRFNSPYCQCFQLRFVSNTILPLLIRLRRIMDHSRTAVLKLKRNI